jgi:hypothetical protein
MIVTLDANSVGWERPLYIRVIREPEDAPGSYPFTLCVRDLNGNLVLKRGFTYDSAKDEQTFSVDVSTLGEGIYSVYIYNWTDCNPPSNVLTFRYWLHRIVENYAYLSLEGWDYRKIYLFMLYVYNGKLFWKYLINTSEAVIPAGVPVYLEVTDASGNAFVGSVATRGFAVLRPNTKIPFMARFRIRYGDRVSKDVVKSFIGIVGRMMNSYVDIVDDYTVEIGIVKDRPGIPLKVAVVIAFAITGALGIWAWHDVQVRSIELEYKRLETVEPLINVFANAHMRYLNQLSLCTTDECIREVVNTWLPILQSIGANIGMLLSSGIPLMKCNGINIGGVCVPWWVVGIMIFVAGLMVVAALK